MNECQRENMEARVHGAKACHDLQGCCFVCTLKNARELSAAQARDLPCLLGPLPFHLEQDPSPAQPLSAGGRLRDAGLRVKWAPLCPQKNREMKWINLPLGLEGGDGARESKEKL